MSGMQFHLSNDHSVDVIGLIGVQTYLCSGSTYFHSLLDGHPNILSLPGLYGWLMLQVEPSAAQMLMNGVDPFEIGLYILNLAPFLDGSAPDIQNGMASLGEEMKKVAGCNGDLFVGWFGHLYSQHSPTKSSFLSSLYLSYCLARNVIPSGDLIICHPVHEEVMNFGAWVDGFGAGSFIYILRDVCPNFVSSVRHLFYASVLGGVVSTHSYVKLVLNGLLLDYSLGGVPEVRHDVPPQPTWADRCRAVRLEDLKTAPRATLSALMRWLRLPWSESLLVSSFDGEKWWNRLNSPRSSQAVQGLEAQRAAALRRSDRWVLAGVSRRRREKWGYAPTASKAAALGVAVVAACLSLRPLRWENAVVDFSGRLGARFFRSRFLPEWLFSAFLQEAQRTTWRRCAHWRDEAAREPFYQPHIAAIEAHLAERPRYSWGKRAVIWGGGKLLIAVLDLERYLAVRGILWRAMRADRDRAESLVELLAVGSEARSD